MEMRMGRSLHTVCKLCYSDLMQRLRKVFELVEIYCIMDQVVSLLKIT